MKTQYARVIAMGALRRHTSSCERILAATARNWFAIAPVAAGGSKGTQIKCFANKCTHLLMYLCNCVNVCVCHKRIISGQYKSAHPLSTHKQVPVLSVCARRYVCVCDARAPPLPQWPLIPLKWQQKCWVVQVNSGSWAEKTTPKYI